MILIAFRHEISALFHLNIKTTISAAELIKAKVTIHVTAFVNTTNISAACHNNGAKQASYYYEISFVTH